MAIWNALTERIGREQVDVWFGDEVEFQVQDGRMSLVTDRFRAERLRRRFGAILEEICNGVLGPEAKVEYVTVGERHMAAAPSFPETDSSPLKKRLSPSPPVSRVGHRCSGAMEFVVGEEHRVFLASVEVVLAQPGKVTPLYIHGASGCGKTLFLATLRRTASERSGLRRIVSVSAEQFTSEFLDALHGKGLPLFRRKFRDVEMLLVDDLQFFSGKRQTLVELQNTVESMLRAGKQVVVAADRPPTELEGFNPVLVGRLTGGLVCQLPYPGFDTRRRIARRLADEHGGLADELIEFVAHHFDGDARRVAGAIYRLVALRKALERPPTLQEARDNLSDLLTVGCRIVRLGDIEAAVCHVFGLEPQELHAENRCKASSQPRMLAMWLARKYTRAGLAEIGQYFGRRSHSTVISAQRKVDQWVRSGAIVRLAHGELPVQDAIRRIEMQLQTA